jgi:16S rRNA (adenine1518-N6/adenine1519-N6)-dimethyltransferase
MSTNSMSLDTLPPLRDVVARYGLEPRKALGQNFLFDLNLTGRIARSAGPLEGVTVLEIGPGPGGLTRALLRAGAKRVITVERDARCIAALQDISAACPEQLTIIEDDALQFDPRPFLGDDPVKIVANLPYNIGTQLLIHWLTSPNWPPFWQSLTLMFQREVAERIVATPLQRADYGRLGVLCNWRCETSILFNVASSAFVPPPKVTSSIVQLVPRPNPLSCSVQALEIVTKAAFGQRRKMLRQSLKGIFEEPSAVLESQGISATARAEEIPVSAYVALGNLTKCVNNRHYLARNLPFEIILKS